MIADTHLRRRGGLPLSCVRHLAASDLILHAGDLIVSEVLEELREIGPPVLAVHGNVDEPALAGELPERLEFEAGEERCGLIHDAGPARGRIARLRAAFPDCGAVVFGHSHIPLHAGEGDFQAFNPGSPTARRRQPCHTMGLLHAGAGGGLRFELVALD